MSGSCQRLHLASFPAIRSANTTNNPAASATTSKMEAVATGTKHSTRQPRQQRHRTGRSTDQPEPMVANGGSRDCPDQHRVIMMGSERVGKTSIVSQFLYDRYTPRYKRTTEDMHRGEYELADGATLTLDILDTCGAMEFPAMRRLSIQYGDAFLLVFAVDDERTWLEVADLRAAILEQRGSFVPLVVVGNKCEVAEEQRQISREAAESIARHDWCCGYVECSAKENVGIVEVFKALLHQSKISYNLSPAVRRRRQSLPAMALPGAAAHLAGAAGGGLAGGGGGGGGARTTKYVSRTRHSCTLS